MTQRKDINKIHIYTKKPGTTVTWETGEKITEQPKPAEKEMPKIFKYIAITFGLIAGFILFMLVYSWLSP